jgi:chorismate mutase/GNAT superfamily N-acetyltransferase
MTDLQLRPADHADLDGVAEVFLAAREAAVPAMPPIARPAEEIRAFYTGLDVDARDRSLWVAERSGGLVGFAEVKGDWLDDLYVVPSAQRQGVGTALLDLVKAKRPSGFSLWVFVSNRPARAFYARHGLLELEKSDGSGNEERAPDLRMVWPGTDPVAFLRGRIDEVDDEIAGLLDRRLALTLAVQARKPVPGPAGRDPEREREIAERMAVHAPALGAERLQRIVHAIITESLDADS